MGRCFTITLLSMLVSVIANAQIQKNYLGLTLGTTTRNEVYQMYPNATRNWAGDMDIASYPGSELDMNTTEGEPALNLHNIKFAGIDWDYVNCSFYQGKLCEVHFSSQDKTSYSSWEDLCTALSKKYGKYRKAVHNDDNKGYSYVVYSDDVTRIVACLYGSRSKMGFYVLCYQHVNLFQKKYQKKLDPNEL